MEDGFIIELFFTRSERAIQELAVKYGGICRKISYNILNNLQDVEECVNDTYLGVWESIPPNRPNPLIAYVCRIARNISLKKYRYNTAQKRNSYYDLSLDELESCIPASSDRSNNSTNEELSSAIELFLGSLDRESRIMFMKRYWFSESVHEISREIGITENHAAVRLMRIRNKLKKYLQQEGITL